MRLGERQEIPVDFRSLPLAEKVRAVEEMERVARALAAARAAKKRD